ncbi:MAG TPA: hypothetical protein VG759_28860 [Candidatus Angelobacter sp.]|nr:hypothetical protein [Candidatus Angelobacter sp.]
MRSRLLLGLVGVCVLLLSRVSLAQGSASISDTVTDPSGAAHVNYSSDDGTVTAAENFNTNGFGRLTSADDPRIGQLGLKILF